MCMCMCMCMDMCMDMCMGMCMCMCMCVRMCVCSACASCREPSLVAAAGLGLTCGVMGNTRGQSRPAGGFLEAGVVVLEVGMKCWVVSRVRGRRLDH